MSHYKYMDYTELSKEDWDSIYNLTKNSLGEDIDNYNSILSFEKKLLEKKSDDIRYSPKRIKHVLGAERGFVSKKLKLETQSHSELLAYYNNIIFDDYKLDIIEALKKGTIDIYVSYYNWFINAIFADYLPLDKLKDVIVVLCKESASELDKNIELLSIFATMELIDGNTKKGLAIFDDLFSRDQFNLLLYIRLLDVLKNNEDYKNLKKYANLASDVALSLDNEEALELINQFVEDIDDEIEDNNLSLISIINNPPSSSDIQNILLKLAIDRFPEEGKIVLDENIEDELKSDAFLIITDYCKTCLKILQDPKLKDEFMKLSIDFDEVQAVYKIMETL